MRIWTTSLLSTLLSITCFHAKAQTTGAWSDQFGEGKGLNGAVYAIVTDSIGNVYVGGDFTVAGNIEALRIAKWSNGTWEALGSGFNDYVQALALGPNGDLYAGGAFTKSDTLNVSRVAHWDGQAWQPLVRSIDNAGSPSGHPQVYTLEVDASGMLYMGGDFRSIDGREAKGIAIWDGTAWSEVGNGFDGSGCVDMRLDDVYDIALNRQNELYVAGNMRNSNDLPINGVAKWNGMTWEGRPANFAVGFCTTLLAAAIYQDTLHVGASFSEIGGVPAQSIAQWNGNGWQALSGNAISGAILSLTSGTGGLYAGGVQLTADNGTTVGVLRWNGDKWESIGGSLNESARIYAIALFENKVYIGGELLREAGNVPSFGIALWESAIANSIGEDTESNAKSNISIYPNPFRDTVTIQFEVLRSQHVAVDVFDTLGRHIAQLASGRFIAGAHSLLFDEESLTPGAYVVRINIGSRPTSFSIIKLP